jgi:hypothetical protein
MSRQFLLVSILVLVYFSGKSQVVNIPIKLDCEIPYIPLIDLEKLDSLATYKIDSARIKKDFRLGIAIYYADSSQSFTQPIRMVTEEKGPFSKFDSPIFPVLESCASQVKWIKVENIKKRGCDVVLLLMFSYVYKVNGLSGPSQASTYMRIQSYPSGRK